MLAYIIRRLLYVVPTLLGVNILVFVLFFILLAFTYDPKTVTDGANDKYPNSTWATANASWPELGKSPNFTVGTAEPKVYTASDVKWYPTGKPSNTMSASRRYMPKY